MWGALVFLIVFVLIDGSTRDAILSALEQAQLQLAVEAPLPYFLLLVLGGSAFFSALIMALWPRAESRTRRVQVLRRYQGQPASEFVRRQRSSALGVHRFFALAWVALPVYAKRFWGRFHRRSGNFVTLGPMRDA